MLVADTLCAGSLGVCSSFTQTRSQALPFRQFWRCSCLSSISGRKCERVHEDVSVRGSGA